MPTPQAPKSSEPVPRDSERIPRDSLKLQVNARRGGARRDGGTEELALHAQESQFSRSFRGRPSTGSPSARAGWSAGRAETVWQRAAPLPVLRKPARKGGDRCPVPLSRCPAPTKAARVRRSRGRSWMRRKWVSSFLGAGKTDPLGRTALREGVG